MKSLFILFLPLFTLAQPNKNKVDSVLLSNDSLYQFVNGNKTLRGIVSSGSTSNTINYLPAGGNYISQSSGTGIVSLGLWNIAIGDNALDSANGGSYNTLLGKDAGKSITTGSDNFYSGWDAGYHTKNGNANIGIVEDALFSNVGGRDNIALGRGAQYSHRSPINNVNIGYNTSYYQLQGIENTGIGAYALGFMEGGYGVTAVGAYAGEMNAAGAGKTIFNSTYLGYCAGLNSMFSNIILIGANTEATADGQINIGNKIFYRNNAFELSGNKLIIGGVQYTFPTSYPAGVQSTLINDGFGNLSWQTISQPITQPVKPQAVYSVDGKLIGYTQQMK